jgi:hypothetical protein
LHAKQAPWPQIKLFETEQLQDMAQLCGNLGVLADLAEISNPANPDYALVLESSSFRNSIPASALRCLTSQDKGDPPLALETAVYLLTNAGDDRRRANARRALGRSVLYHLIGSTGRALAEADQNNLWNDQVFQQQLVHWLVAQNLNAAYPSREFLALLDARLAGTQRYNLKLPAGAAKLAATYKELQFAVLPEILSPALGDDPLYGRLIDALLQGSQKSDAWKNLVDRVKEFSSANPDDHPLMILAAKILQLPPKELGQIDRHGWPTLRGVCERPDAQAPYILQAVQAKPVLPVLHLAVVLRDEDSLGRIATGILSLKGIATYLAHAPWWTAFFESLGTCQRRSGLREARDRQEAAVAVICRAMSDLEISHAAGWQELDKYVGMIIPGMNQGRFKRQIHLERTAQ